MLFRSPRILGPTKIGDFQLDEDISGNLVVKHTPTGNTWKFKPNGTLVSTSFSESLGTLVSAVQSSTDGDINPGASNWAVVSFATEVKDTLNEWSSGSFVPDSDGFYRFDVHAYMSTAGDQDPLHLAVYDVGASSIIGEVMTHSSGTNEESLGLSMVLELVSGTEYKIRAKNDNHNTVVKGNEDRTRLAIDSVLKI